MKILHSDGHYDVVVSENVYNIFKPDGELIIRAVDTEDGVIFTPTPKECMEYHEMGYLRMMLNLMNAIDKRLFEKTELVQEITDL